MIESIKGLLGVKPDMEKETVAIFLKRLDLVIEPNIDKTEVMKLSKRHHLSSKYISVIKGTYHDRLSPKRWREIIVNVYFDIYQKPMPLEKTKITIIPKNTKH